ncbi:FAD:protein FMN transferase [Phocaeicola barnesiae]|jgi:thiamine biosynthesis lipoprotein|uniref:FAD:protein FMN transferase n=1 Tax=Phocaeicola barnesiae TaxID=376804 RepID=UPI0025A3FDEE|nr:FAD:protein FMN transferase [Phocaeicola barnesiae]MDM8240486.1 FAD:protein FMN transferase [Phocaeicola barnesiae]MDM8253958.1 FAD:protein FMN transferase [Phocaeicola barnesiae]
MANKQLRWQLPFLVVLIVGTVLILRKQAPYQTDQGIVFGTIYKITYQSEENLKDEIEAELKKVDNSLSPFNKASVITHINENTDLTADSLFTEVFLLAKQISQETHGAFDITVAPLVNAWGFGFKNAAQVDSIMIDSLHQFVGIDKVELIDGKVVKKDPRLMLDCSAIAKGYGVDCVARLLDSKGIRNYMIDIGGELVMKGENPKMETWSIGVNKPIDDSLSVNQEIQAVLKLTNVGLATSGNYRNFYYKGGKKYAHTIDPRTGYPIQHNILSATVVAPDCATADAYATSFMVLGLDSAKQICNAHPELDAYFIYTTDKGNTEIYYTTGMKQYLQQH